MPIQAEASTRPNGAPSTHLVLGILPDSGGRIQIVTRAEGSPCRLSSNGSPLAALTVFSQIPACPQLGDSHLKVLLTVAQANCDACEQGQVVHKDTLSWQRPP